jgi:hypothetical protein
MTVSAEKPSLFSDLALSRRLERAEARANAEFVEARARLAPESGATWIDVAGAYAMYDGPASPCTQTFGLGLFQPPTPADLEKLERFFQERGAPVFHEVSPLADSALPLLNERGYQPIEFSALSHQDRHRVADPQRRPLFEKEPSMSAAVEIYAKVTRVLVEPTMTI